MGRKSKEYYEAKLKELELARKAREAREALRAFRKALKK